MIKKSTYLKYTLVTLMLGFLAQNILAQGTVLSSSEPRSFYPSGSADIDEYRKLAKESPTTPENYQQRVLLLNLWLYIAQQRSANTHSLFDSDYAYFTGESDLLKAKGEVERKEVLQRICTAIDDGYKNMEEIFRQLNEDGPIFEPFTGDPSRFPESGNMEDEWTSFQHDKHNTGYTTAPGPKTGETVWKFPVGLGWYASPVIEGESIYLASPGMHTTSKCLDLKTGEEIWKSTQHHERMGVYKYPAIMSTPVVLEDRIILREVNSHGGNEGQARNLVYVDKKTGETLNRKYAGHIDYRTQVAPVVSNGKQIVYPFGVHDIYSTPAICQNLNRLICADLDNKKKHWDLILGDIDVLAEPVMTETHVIQGTTDGYLYSVGLIQRDDIDNEWAFQSRGGEIAWKFKAEGGIHTSVAVQDEAIYFGSNGGVIYSLNERDGSLIWETKVKSVEKRTRKHFTVPVLADGKLYIGSANNQFYCLDAKSGEILWQVEQSDWIRSKPVLTSNGLFVAAVDGSLSFISLKGKIKWTKKVSNHQFYADLKGTDDLVLLSDSDLWLYCYDTKGNEVWKHSILNAYVNDQGDRIFTDQLAGGTYYQSKPTAADGKVYFGNPGGFLFCVDAETGEENWKFEMGGAISVGAVIYDGKVYGGQQGGERFFYCMDAKTGKLIWKQTLPGGWVWGSAVADDGVIYVPTVDGYAVALDANTGHIIWMYRTARSLPAEPAIDGDIVYFGSWSHSLYAFDKKTGEIIWKQSGVGLDSGTLFAQDGVICVPNNKDVFKYLDGKTGDVIFEGIKDPKVKGNYRNFNATGALHRDKAYFSARAGVGMGGVPMATRMYALDYKTGEVFWKFPDGGGLSAPAVASERVYAASGNTPLLYCLDAESGKPHWVYKMGQHVEEATLCIYRDKLYVLSADGYVHAVK